MRGRFWFYLAVTIVIAGELTFLLSAKDRLNGELALIDNAALTEKKTDLGRYVKAQKDERKLVSLAKRIKYENPAVLQVIIDRAYEINPNSRDITILASTFHPELKAKIKELDPLFKE